MATKAESHPNLTIIADENLLLPLARIAREYANASNTPLTVVLRNANGTERQIEQGLEAHLVISANKPLMDRLSEQGLTDVTSRRVVARTQLALVSASTLGEQGRIAKRISFAALLHATPNLPIYASDPGSIAGDLTELLLKNATFSDTLVSRLHRYTGHEEIIDALRDSESLALTLATDAALEPDITVLALLPDSIIPPVQVESVVLGSELMAPSKSFANFLITPHAQAIFKRFGFQPPPL